MSQTETCKKPSVREYVHFKDNEALFRYGKWREDTGFLPTLLNVAELQKAIAETLYGEYGTGAKWQSDYASDTDNRDWVFRITKKTTREAKIGRAFEILEDEAELPEEAITAVRGIFDYCLCAGRNGLAGILEKLAALQHYYDSKP